MNQRETLQFNNQEILEIGNISTIDLAKKYGTPLYVMDQTHIEKMCHVFSSTLEKEYGDGLITYASKAFSCKEIYRIIKKQNVGADSVSGGELYTALKAGFDLSKVCFHGNNKSKDELYFAINNNIGYIVIDSYVEADIIDQICQKLNKKQNVLIRINPGVEAHTHHFIQTAKIDSKFGFSISNGQANDIIKHVKEKNNINLSGLHCHIGSQIFEKKSFVIAVEKMTDYYKQLKDELNIEFDVLNLGGGFGIYYSGDDPKLTYSDYAEYVKTIADTLKDAVLRKGLKKPFLILEPGRSIVGEAGITLYTVGNVKTITDVKNYIAIDGGMFENPRFALYQAKYTVVPAKNNNNDLVKYTIAGKCCESGDIIAEDVILPKVNVGDILAVTSTGAYNYSMASNYNRNRIPPVVIVKNGKSKYIIKPQTYKDLIRNDV